MKKLFAAFAAALLCVGLGAGCTSSTGSAGQSSSSVGPSAEDGAGKIGVVCATFPAYDWVNQVIGDNSDRFEVTYLMGSGMDLHSFQPAIEDIAKISNADLFVYVGGESDDWAEDAVEAAGNSDLRTVSMLDVVGDDALEEEVVEGMQADEHEGGHASEEGPEYDEHVWLSLRNAQVLVDAIADELSALDAENAAAYAANADAYKAKLSDLDERFAQVVHQADTNTVVFADRFPFRYLVDDYGLSYFAAFVGCSAETEASFETIAFLAQKVDELNLGSVLVIENSDQKIAETVIRNTRTHDQNIIVMDSLQSAADAEVAAGKTYLSAMEANLEALASALA